MGKTLITGGWGLVGSEIPDSEQYKRPRHASMDLCGSYTTDVRDAMHQFDISEVIHLAAKVGGVKGNNDNMMSYFMDNMVMNTNILRACSELESIKKATFMLSTCVFPAKATYPVDELQLHNGEPHHTNYGYAYAKRMLEVGARTLRQNGKQARCIIPCNIYGKNDNYDIVNGHVIPSLIHKCYLAKKNDTELVVWGSGDAEREFIYAPDIARAVVEIHNDDRKDDELDLMIVSPNISYKIRDIVFMIADSFDFTGKIVFDITSPEGILRKPTSAHKFRKFYPNFKFTGIEQGIAQTCKFVEENYDSLRK